MNSRKFYALQKLEENSHSLYERTTNLLLKIVENIIGATHDSKYRTLRLDNAILNDKLIPVIGAMECLFEIGFTEGDECLFLPDTVPLDHLRAFRTELQERRAKFLQRPSAKVPAHQSQSESSATQPFQAPVLQTLWKHSTMVLQYEDPVLQRRARELVPLGALVSTVEDIMAAVRSDVKAGRLPPGSEPHPRDVLLLELMHWFKSSFFSWVDAPACVSCKGPTTWSGQQRHSSIRVEVYECGACRERTLFPRYNDAGKLLETRRGRCGEWANCFTLLCRALGWDARLVVDSADHVWSEVFSAEQGRWLHCDPCEDVCDQPLLYEVGWGKQLSYVLAFSRDDVQDVTWRYSSSWHDVMLRRTSCSEQELLHAILSLRKQRQACLSPARRAFLQRRLITELVHFLSPASRTATAAEQQGRTSGSMAWRLSRQEVQPHTWLAGPEQASARRLAVSYCTSSDCYYVDHGKKHRRWHTGVFSMQNIFRKEEHDWGTVYLARTEGSSEGSVMWKLDVGSTGLVVDTVSVHYSSYVCNSGQVQWKLCSKDERCLVLPNDVDKMSTSILSGCTEVTLSVHLSGGEGNQAWQHAQILRQPKDSTECLFSIELTLKQP